MSYVQNETYPYHLPVFKLENEENYSSIRLNEVKIDDNRVNISYNDNAMRFLRKKVDNNLTGNADNFFEVDDVKTEIIPDNQTFKFSNLNNLMTVNHTHQHEVFKKIPKQQQGEFKKDSENSKINTSLSRATTVINQQSQPSKDYQLEKYNSTLTYYMSTTTTSYLSDDTVKLISMRGNIINKNILAHEVGEIKPIAYSDNWKPSLLITGSNGTFKIINDEKTLSTTYFIKLDSTFSLGLSQPLLACNSNQYAFSKNNVMYFNQYYTAETTNEDFKLGTSSNYTCLTNNLFNYLKLNSLQNLNEHFDKNVLGLPSEVFRNSLIPKFNNDGLDETVEIKMFKGNEVIGYHSSNKTDETANVNPEAHYSNAQSVSVKENDLLTLRFSDGDKKLVDVWLIVNSNSSVIISFVQTMALKEIKNFNDLLLAEVRKYDLSNKCKMIQGMLVNDFKNFNYLYDNGWWSNLVENEPITETFYGKTKINEVLNNTYDYLDEYTESLKNPFAFHVRNHNENQNFITKNAIQGNDGTEQTLDNSTHDCILYYDSSSSYSTIFNYEFKDVSGSSATSVDINAKINAKDKIVDVNKIRTFYNSNDTHEISVYNEEDVVVKSGLFTNTTKADGTYHFIDGIYTSLTTVSMTEITEITTSENYNKDSQKYLGVNGSGITEITETLTTATTFDYSVKETVNNLSFKASVNSEFTIEPLVTQVTRKLMNENLELQNYIQAYKIDSTHFSNATSESNKINEILNDNVFDKDVYYDFNLSINNGLINCEIMTSETAITKELNLITSYQTDVSFVTSCYFGYEDGDITQNNILVNDIELIGKEKTDETASFSTNYNRISYTYSDTTVSFYTPVRNDLTISTCYIYYNGNSWTTTTSTSDISNGKEILAFPCEIMEYNDLRNKVQFTDKIVDNENRYHPLFKISCNGIIKYLPMFDDNHNKVAVPSIEGYEILNYTISSTKEEINAHYDVDELSHRIINETSSTLTSVVYKFECLYSSGWGNTPDTTTFVYSKTSDMTNKCFIYDLTLNDRHYYYYTTSTIGGKYLKVNNMDIEMTNTPTELKTVDKCSRVFNDSLEITHGYEQIIKPVNNVVLNVFDKTLAFKSYVITSSEEIVEDTEIYIPLYTLQAKNVYDVQNITLTADSVIDVEDLTMTKKISLNVLSMTQANLTTSLTEIDLPKGDETFEIETYKNTINYYFAYAIKHNLLPTRTFNNTSKYDLTISLTQDDILEVKYLINSVSGPISYYEFSNAFRTKENTFELGPYSAELLYSSRSLEMSSEITVQNGFKININEDSFYNNGVIDNSQTRFITLQNDIVHVEIRNAIDIKDSNLDIVLSFGYQDGFGLIGFGKNINDLTGDGLNLYSDNIPSKEEVEITNKNIMYKLVNKEIERTDDCDITVSKIECYNTRENKDSLEDIVKKNQRGPEYVMIMKISLNITNLMAGEILTFDMYPKFHYYLPGQGLLQEFKHPIEYNKVLDETFDTSKTYENIIYYYQEYDSDNFKNGISKSYQRGKKYTNSSLVDGILDPNISSDVVVQVSTDSKEMKYKIDLLTYTQTNDTDYYFKHSDVTTDFNIKVGDDSPENIIINYNDYYINTERTSIVSMSNEFKLVDGVHKANKLSYNLNLNSDYRDISGKQFNENDVIDYVKNDVVYSGKISDIYNESSENTKIKFIKDYTMDYLEDEERIYTGKFKLAEPSSLWLNKIDINLPLVNEIVIDSRLTINEISNGVIRYNSDKSIELKQNVINLNGWKYGIIPKNEFVRVYLPSYKILSSVYEDLTVKRNWSNVDIQTISSEITAEIDIDDSMYEERYTNSTGSYTVYDKFIHSDKKVDIAFTLNDFHLMTIVDNNENLMSGCVQFRYNSYNKFELFEFDDISGESYVMSNDSFEITLTISNLTVTNVNIYYTGECQKIPEEIMINDLVINSLCFYKSGVKIQVDGGVEQTFENGDFSIFKGDYEYKFIVDSRVCRYDLISNTKYFDKMRFTNRVYTNPSQKLYGVTITDKYGNKFCENATLICETLDYVDGIIYPLWVVQSNDKYYYITNDSIELSDVNFSKFCFTNEGIIKSGNYFVNGGTQISMSEYTIFSYNTLINISTTTDKLLFKTLECIYPNEEKDYKIVYDEDMGYKVVNNVVKVSENEADEFNFTKTNFGYNIYKNGYITKLDDKLVVSTNKTYWNLVNSTDFINPNIKNYNVTGYEVNWIVENGEAKVSTDLKDEYEFKTNSNKYLNLVTCLNKPFFNSGLKYVVYSDNVSSIKLNRTYGKKYVEVDDEFINNDYSNYSFEKVDIYEEVGTIKTINVISNSCLLNQNLKMSYNKNIQKDINVENVSYCENAKYLFKRKYEIEKEITNCYEVNEYLNNDVVNPLALPTFKLTNEIFVDSESPDDVYNIRTNEVIGYLKYSYLITNSTLVINNSTTENPVGFNRYSLTLNPFTVNEITDNEHAEFSDTYYTTELLYKNYFVPKQEDDGATYLLNYRHKTLEFDTSLTDLFGVDIVKTYIVNNVGGKSITNFGIYSINDIRLLSKISEVKNWNANVYDVAFHNLLISYDRPEDESEIWRIKYYSNSTNVSTCSIEMVSAYKCENQIVEKDFKDEYDINVYDDEVIEDLDFNGSPNMNNPNNCFVAKGVIGGEKMNAKLSFIKSSQVLANVYLSMCNGGCCVVENNETHIMALKTILNYENNQVDTSDTSMNNCIEISYEDAGVRTLIKTLLMLNIDDTSINNKVSEMIEDREIMLELLTNEHYIKLMLNDYKLFLKDNNPDISDEEILTRVNNFNNWIHDYVVGEYGERTELETNQLKYEILKHSQAGLLYVLRNSQVGYLNCEILVNNGNYKTITKREIDNKYIFDSISIYNCRQYPSKPNSEPYFEKSLSGINKINAINLFDGLFYLKNCEVCKMNCCDNHVSLAFSNINDDEENYKPYQVENYEYGKPVYELNNNGMFITTMLPNSKDDLESNLIEGVITFKNKSDGKELQRNVYSFENFEDDKIKRCELTLSTGVKDYKYNAMYIKLLNTDVEFKENDDYKYSYIYSFNDKLIRGWTVKDSMLKSYITFSNSTIKFTNTKSENFIVSGLYTNTSVIKTDVNRDYTEIELDKNKYLLVNNCDKIRINNFQTETEVYKLDYNYTINPSGSYMKVELPTVETMFTVINKEGDFYAYEIKFENGTERYLNKYKVNKDEENLSVGCVIEYENAGVSVTTSVTTEGVEINGIMFSYLTNGSVKCSYEGVDEVFETEITLNDVVYKNIRQYAVKNGNVVYSDDINPRFGSKKNVIYSAGELIMTVACPYTIINGITVQENKPSLNDIDVNDTVYYNQISNTEHLIQYVNSKCKKETGKNNYEYENNYSLYISTIDGNYQMENITRILNISEINNSVDNSVVYRFIPNRDYLTFYIPFENEDGRFNDIEHCYVEIEKFKAVYNNSFSEKDLPEELRIFDFDFKTTTTSTTSLSVNNKLYLDTFYINQNKFKDINELMKGINENIRNNISTSLNKDENKILLFNEEIRNNLDNARINFLTDMDGNKYDLLVPWEDFDYYNFKVYIRKDNEYKMTIKFTDGTIYQSIGISGEDLDVDYELNLNEFFKGNLILKHTIKGSLNLEFKEIIYDKFINDELFFNIIVRNKDFITYENEEYKFLIDIIPVEFTEDEIPEKVDYLRLIQSNQNYQKEVSENAGKLLKFPDEVEDVNDYIKNYFDHSRFGISFKQLRNGVWRKLGITPILLNKEFRPKIKGPDNVDDVIDKNYYTRFNEIIYYNYLGDYFTETVYKSSWAKLVHKIIFNTTDEFGNLVTKDINGEVDLNVMNFFVDKWKPERKANLNVPTKFSIKSTISEDVEYSLNIGGNNTTISDISKYEKDDNGQLVLKIYKTVDIKDIKEMFIYIDSTTGYSFEYGTNAELSLEWIK